MEGFEKFLHQRGPISQGIVPDLKDAFVAGLKRAAEILNSRTQHFGNKDTAATLIAYAAEIEAEAERIGDE